MPTKSTVQTTRIKSRAEQLREEIESATKQLEYYESVPEDVYENGAVLLFFKKFSDQGIRYTYSCLKAAGFWYITGRSDRYTWDALTDFLYGNIGSQGSIQVFHVTEISEVV